MNRHCGYKCRTVSIDIVLYGGTCHAPGKSCVRAEALLVKEVAPSADSLAQRQVNHAVVSKLHERDLSYAAHNNTADEDEDNTSIDGKSAVKVRLGHRKAEFNLSRLQYLIDRLSQSDEKYVVLMFGDHQPPLVEQFYETLFKKKQSEFTTDAVFIFTGMLPQTELVEMLPKDGNGYIVTDETMATSMPGLFAAGDVRSKSFRQVVTATADGAIAAHSAYEFLHK